MPRPRAGGRGGGGVRARRRCRSMGDRAVDARPAPAGGGRGSDRGAWRSGRRSTRWWPSTTRACAWPRSPPSGSGSARQPARGGGGDARQGGDAARRFAAAGVPQPELPDGRPGRRRGGGRRRGRASRSSSSRSSLSASRGVIRADDPRGGRGGGRAGAGDPRRGRGGPGRAAAGRALRAGRRGGGRGALARRRARGARGLRQARPARGPVLRGDDLRHAVAAARREIVDGRRAPHDRGCRAALGLREGPVHAELRVARRATCGCSSSPPARSAGCARARCASALGVSPRGGDPAPRARAAARRPAPRGRRRRA